jgi:hypothetical protein
MCNMNDGLDQALIRLIGTCIVVPTPNTTLSKPKSAVRILGKVRSKRSDLYRNNGILFRKKLRRDLDKPGWTDIAGKRPKPFHYTADPLYSRLKRVGLSLRVSPSMIGSCHVILKSFQLYVPQVQNNHTRFSRKATELIEAQFVHRRSPWAKILARDTENLNHVSPTRSLPARSLQTNQSDQMSQTPTNKFSVFDGPVNLFELYFASNTHQGYAELFENYCLYLGKNFHHRNFQSVRGIRNGCTIDAFELPATMHCAINQSESDSSTIRQIFVREDADPRSTILAMIDMRGNDSRRSAELYCVGEVYSQLSELLQNFLMEGEKSVYRAGVEDQKVAIQQEPYFIDDTCRPHSEFYPYLGDDIEAHIESVLNSKDPLTVYYGSPGNGKSTLLRGMVERNPGKTLFAYDKALMSNTELLKQFYQGPWNLLILEDAELLLASRDDGNESASAMLNYLDGVVRYPNKRVVVTLNVPSLSKIEEAMLRAGRTNETYHMRNLTLEEAIAARESIGLTVHDGLEQQGNEFSLANTLKYNGERFRKTKTSIGFAPN